MIELKDGNTFINQLLAVSGAKNSAALGRILELSKPEISHIRSGKRKVGPTVILRVHEALGLPVKTIREMLSSKELE